ncbi:ribonuclease H-like domain-containing protein [Tanacetum coccineum]
MVNYNPSRTPIDFESKIGVDGVPVSDSRLYIIVLQVLYSILHLLDQIFHMQFSSYFLPLPQIWLLFRMQIDWLPYYQTFYLSNKAEYRGVANVVTETSCLRNLLRELHTSLSSATFTYYDNVNAVYLSCNLVQHQRTKHIEIDIHFIWDLVVVGQVCVLHVPSRYQYADIFTKGLPPALFEEFRSSLSVRCPPT